MVTAWVTDWHYAPQQCSTLHYSTLQHTMFSLHFQLFGLSICKSFFFLLSISHCKHLTTFFTVERTKSFIFSFFSSFLSFSLLSHCKALVHTNRTNNNSIRNHYHLIYHRVCKISTSSNSNISAAAASHHLFISSSHHHINTSS